MSTDELLEEFLMFISMRGSSVSFDNVVGLIIW